MRATGIRVIIAEPYTSASLARQSRRQDGRARGDADALGRRRAARPRDYLALFDLNVARLAAARCAAARMIDFLGLPFLACLVLTGIHVYLGLHVLARGVIFVDLALAQVAALGHHGGASGRPSRPERAAYWYALAFTVGGASLFAASRVHRAPIPQEAIIGIVYAVSAAAHGAGGGPGAAGRRAHQDSCWSAASSR